MQASTSTEVAQNKRERIYDFVKSGKGTYGRVPGVWSTAAKYRLRLSQHELKETFNPGNGPNTAANQRHRRHHGPRRKPPQGITVRHTTNT